MTRSLTTTFTSFVCLAVVLTAGNSAAAEWFDVQREDRYVTIEATGEIVSSDMMQFGPPPSQNWQMAIASIAVEGQRVNAGDLLVRFESSMQDDRMRNITGQLTMVRGELQKVIQEQAQEIETEELELAEKKSLAEKAQQKADYPADLIPSVEYRTLAERREIARVVYERAQLRAPLSEKVREAKRKQLDASIRTFESQLAALNKEMAAFTIHAPRAGLVTLGEDWNGDKFDTNDRVHPGHVVVYLVDDSKLEVTGTVPEHLAAHVALGQLADLIVDSNTGASAHGRVSKVGSTVRRKSRNSNALVRDFTVELIDSHANDLKLGKSVQITLHVDQIRDAYTVPDSALVYRNGNPGVIASSGWTPVELGARSGDRFIVTAGLDNIERVRL